MFFFDRAFRSFFLGGAIFTFISMWVWWLNYPAPIMNFSGVTPIYWHAHEMVFGYALATVTGFLLTAVMNWTRGNSASGRWLAAVFALWVGARLGYLVDAPLLWVALLDMGFTFGLFLHFVVPVVKSRQWKQMGLASKFLLLVLANGLYYVGVAGWSENGMVWGITLGLFLVLGINLTMMRRLIPFFTEKALRLPEQVNPEWMDAVSILGFLALMIAAAFFPTHWATAAIAFPLAAVHAVRALALVSPGDLANFIVVAITCFLCVYGVWYVCLRFGRVGCLCRIHCHSCLGRRRHWFVVFIDYGTDWFGSHQSQCV